MATIVTRAGKGSPLTHNEVDANFTNLNSDKIESGDTVASLTLTAVDVADKITHTGDTDTSIRFPAADTVTVETAGSERMRITSSGNVGIGTNSPAAKLHVDGDNIANTFKLIANTTVSGSDATIFRPSDNTMAFSTNGAERVRIDSGGNVGIGTSSPVSFERLTLTGDGSTIVGGLALISNGNTAYLGAVGATVADVEYWNAANGYIRFGTNNAERMRITSSGNVGIGTSSPSATLDVNGSLSKSSGSFKIDHPIKPDTHHLVHSFIEGPQADNIYRGKATLAGGTATVNLDEAGRMSEGTFVALNGNVQCFTTNEDGWVAVRGKVDGNILTIEAQDAACTDTVSWLVIGERHDQHMIDANWTDEQGRIITEPEKETAS